MLKIFDIKAKSFPVTRKIILWASGIILFLAIFFTYVTNVTIDAASDELLATLKVLFWIFICLAPFAVAAIVIFIILREKELADYYKVRNKSTLGKKVRLFDVLNMLWMAIFCVMCVYPIIYVLIGSFNQGADYARGGVYLIPRLFTFENYRVVLEKSEMWHSYLVTIGRTALGTVSALVFTSIVAYAISRPNLKFKGVIYWINLLTMFFSGGLIPYFLVITAIGLYDNFFVYIIPALYSVYNMIVISSFFKSVSNELHEAALVDGASEFRIWWQIYMPLSKPVLATVALWLAIGHWNSYFDTMIYTSSKDLHTLQYFLLQAIQSSTMTEGMTETMLQRVSAKTISLAAIIISIIPVLFFFPFVRKNFQSGIMIGSLKG
ncbi:MAG: carbohydrate ABC transporter permease [Clostridia bacterium]|nr:carbohydrate ABC transporter permease [Clostridia bacterium]